ncbi:unnamed protein product, partial [Mesorhabditis belari]|uniref:Major facilitator superfamily (MFS) profile domain-containing protein n=1 Tax=Mesorhabditis belari TaxID=2138241 RepID=A0AAF3ER44_9BILA
MTTKVSPSDRKKAPRVFSFHSYRLRICILMMLALTITHCMRLNLTIGIHCMVNSTLLHEKYNTTLHKGSENTGSLDWSPTEQSWIFSASSYGSLVATLLSGYVADRFQPKIVITLGILGAAMMTALGPLLASNSYWGFFLSRTIQGISGGFIFPAASAMASRWFPPMEKSTLGSIYAMGNALGGSMVPMIVAFLCTTPLGWPSAFYAFSIAAFLYIILWIFFVSNHPSSNRFISEREREYLEKEIDFHSGVKGNHEEKGPKNFPWTKLFFSITLFANYSCQIAYQFTQSTMQLFLPMYFRDNLGFSIKENGLYTTLPAVLYVVMGLVWGALADFLKKKKVMSKQMTTKVFQSISSFGTAFSLLMIYLIPSEKHPNLVLPFLISYGVLFPAGVGGYFTSLLSVCPRFTGTVMSINRGWGMIAHLGTPMLMTLLSYLDLSYKYFIMFGMGAALEIIAGSLFIVFGDCEVQNWAKIDADQATLDGETTGERNQKVA